VPTRSPNPQLSSSPPSASLGFWPATANDGPPNLLHRPPTQGGLRVAFLFECPSAARNPRRRHYRRVPASGATQLVSQQKVVSPSLKCLTEGPKRPSDVLARWTGGNPAFASPRPPRGSLGLLACPGGYITFQCHSSGPARERLFAKVFADRTAAMRSLRYRLIVSLAIYREHAGVI
jgi:hypothetical protein